MYMQKLYNSPLGTIIIVSDEDGIVGLWLPGQLKTKLPERIEPYTERYAGTDEEDMRDAQRTAYNLKEATEWLDGYFGGEKPDPKALQLNLRGTEFRKQVWDILIEIPYGETVSYGEIADEVAKIRGKAKMSSRAVGAANGSNPISIVVPCHRVVGSNSHLIGYGGGLPLKKWLLEHEGLTIVNYRIVTL